MSPRDERRRVCKYCGAPRPSAGQPDPCLGWLPGVRSACCGHGVTAACYVVLHGRDAAEVQRRLGGNPPAVINDDPIRAWSEDWPLDPEPKEDP